MRLGASSGFHREFPKSFHLASQPRVLYVIINHPSHPSLMSLSTVITHRDVIVIIRTSVSHGYFCKTALWLMMRERRSLLPYSWFPCWYVFSVSTSSSALSAGPQIPYFDNSECLRLLQNQPGRLIHIMDDQARCTPKKTDHMMVKAFGKRWGNHSFFKVGRGLP